MNRVRKPWTAGVLALATMVLAAPAHAMSGMFCQPNDMSLVWAAHVLLLVCLGGLFSIHALLARSQWVAAVLVMILMNVPGFFAFLVGIILGDDCNTKQMTIFLATGIPIAVLATVIYRRIDRRRIQWFRAKPQE